MSVLRVLVPRRDGLFLHGESIAQWSVRSGHLAVHAAVGEVEPRFMYGLTGD